MQKTARRITERVDWVGAVDWNRRLFDSLIPLPDGTSYNAYILKGSEKTALLDTVDPRMRDVLLERLQKTDRIDYLVAHHAEQDHSGAIPDVLSAYPDAKVLTSEKGRQMLLDLLEIPEASVEAVGDGSTVSLGDRSLTFLSTPWVHWPETMCSYCPEERMLFSCDFFGSHLATTDLYAVDEPRVVEAAKRYYAEIMMPFRTTIRKNIEKVQQQPLDVIAPSHGPIYGRPSFIVEAYRDWVSDGVKNVVVLPYVSMHGSTEKMVNYLVDSLAARDVHVGLFDLTVTDLGKLAISLVDAATIIVGTPTVLAGAHPAVAYAAHLTAALRPKLRFAGVIGSYGWGGKATEQIAEFVSGLKVELLDPVLCRGIPREETFLALDKLASAIAERHCGL